MEKGVDRLAREAVRHRNRIEEIMGEDALVLQPCVLCEEIIPGFVMPPALDDARKAKVRVMIGDKEPAAWQADLHSRRCADCDGLGEVLTGSQVHGQETLPCVACKGKGWIGDHERGAVAPPPPPQLAEVAGNGPPPSGQGVEPPEVAALKAQGYTILDPVRRP